MHEAPDGLYKIIHAKHMGVNEEHNGLLVNIEDGRWAGYAFVTGYIEDGYIIKHTEEIKMSTKEIAAAAREELRKKLKTRAGASVAPIEPDAFDEMFGEVKPIPSIFAEMEAPEGLSGVLYSELFGAMPPKGGDFHVHVYADDDWDEEGQSHIPKIEKFHDFVIDHAALSVELRALQASLKVLMTGPSGCGKTTLQEFICAKTRQPYLRVNGRQDMDSVSLIGQPWVRDGSMGFELGELPKAMKNGWFMAFDEPWKMPAGIHMVLQRTYEQDGILQLDDMPGSLSDKQIVPKNTFRMVLCDNVVGTGDNASKYGATMIQDGSTLNRMDVVIKMNYLSFEDEVNMVQKMHPNIELATIKKMVKFGALIRVGYEQDELSAAFSPRNHDAWGKMATAMQDIRAGFEATVLERYAEDAERAAVEEHYRNVFG